MTTTTVEGGTLLAICAAVTVAMQCSFFAVAFLCQFDKVTDLAGTLNFAVLALLSLLVQDVYDTRGLVVTAAVLVWALRLGAFLVARVLRRGRDERFDEMRKDCAAFFGFWVFQIIWVFIVSLPVMLVNSCDSNDVPAFGKNAQDIVGIVLWAIGFLLEWAADASKDAFNKDTANKGKLLCTGVWKYSRHPNYFGEILCWLGLTIVASSSFDSSGESWFYVSVLSPVLTFVLLMFLSGVPLAEDRYDERFGLQPFYLDYKNSTSPLLCFPPGIYKHLPLGIKRVLFLELPMYSRKLNELHKSPVIAELE